MHERQAFARSRSDAGRETNWGEGLLEDCCRKKGIFFSIEIWLFTIKEKLIQRIQLRETLFFCCWGPSTPFLLHLVYFFVTLQLICTSLNCMHGLSPNIAVSYIKFCLNGWLGLVLNFCINNPYCGIFVPVTAQSIVASLLMAVGFLISLLFSVSRNC